MSLATGRIATLLGVSILIASGIFLFSPFTIYSGNPQEFIVPLGALFKLLVLPALGVAAVLFLAGLFLPEKAYQRYVAIVFALGILIWLQGNIFVWKYGLLDGQGINWSKDAWRGWVDGILWAGVLAFSVVFYRRFWGAARLVSFLLIGMQLGLLVFSSVNKPETWKQSERFTLPVAPPEGLYELSSKANVIQITLDALQSDIVYEIIQENGDYYKEALDGFTFFSDTVGSFPTTKLSIPAIFSGRPYKNDEPMADFLKETLEGNTLSNFLYDKGYRVDVAHSNPAFLVGKLTNTYLPPVPYGTTREKYEESSARFLIDLSLFRSAPHFLKKYIYNDQMWLVQDMTDNTEVLSRTRHFSAKMFVQDVIDNMHIATDSPVYKFIHPISTHPPIIVNSDCGFAGRVLPSTRENIKVQFRCSLDQVIELLEKLKDLGLYDSSLIVIQGDHGISNEVKLQNADKGGGGSILGNESLFPSIVGGAMPALIIKPPNAKGPLKVSNEEAMLTDIPATVSDLLGYKGEFKDVGEPLFDMDPGEKRERQYHYYKWRNENWQDDYFEHLYEFTVEGPVDDKASWRQSGIYMSADPASYRTNKIDMGTSQADRFKYYGFSGDEKTPDGRIKYAWAVGGSAAVFMALPKDRQVTLTANVTTLPSEKPQEVTVKVDGRKVGNWTLNEPSKLARKSVVIKPDRNRPDISVIEFDFSQTQRVPTDPYNRDLAVLFESINIDG